MIRVLSFKDQNEIGKTFRDLHVDKVGIKIMLPKTDHKLIQIDSLNVPAANILKQELLSLGGDVALHKGACNFSVKETRCLLMGTKEHFNQLIRKLAAQPFGLKKIGKELKEVLEKFHSIPPPLKLGSYVLDFSKSPFIMGILNVTPDSFSGDGFYLNINEVLKKAESFLKEGASILDVGGESTRPGSVKISLKEELRRVLPVVKEIVKRFKIPISIDTSKARVAEETLTLGAHLINDVSGLADPQMVGVVKKYQASLVLMHPKLNSGKSVDTIGEVCEFFENQMEALLKKGIPPSKLILDPGIGFGKTAEQNLYILRKIEEFKVFGRPLLLGTSRKSFIGKVLKNEVGDRLTGSVASLVFGYLKGVHIFRVHDVKESREVLALTKTIAEAHEG